jgi:Na+/H+-dicarboxylate symporter
MTRRQLAVVAIPIVVVAFIVGFVIFEQGWSLAATLLVSYGVIAFLTTIAVVLALVVFPHGGPDSRTPAVTRSR